MQSAGYCGTGNCHYPGAEAVIDGIKPYNRKPKEPTVTPWGLLNGDRYRLRIKCASCGMVNMCMCYGSVSGNWTEEGHVS